MAQFVNYKSPRIPATKAISQFVSETQSQHLSLGVREKLKELLLDYIGVSAAASVHADSTEPISTAITSFNTTPGSNTVFKKGQKYNPQIAALLNGALSHSLDFDDTFARGCLHPGTAIVSAVLAEAESLNSTAERIFAALAVGYEVVCRIAMQLHDGSYERGFHNTGTAGIFGCVAGISSLRGLSAIIVENAFGLAGSKAAGSMQFLENGSWNKRLHPGFAAHDAFLCVSMAEAGVIGSSDCLEGRLGFFRAYSPRTPDLEGLTKDLKKEWVFLGTALKPFPACRMTHGAIELCNGIATLTGRNGDAVEKITVCIRNACISIVGLPVPNKIHPQNIVDAQFSIYYQIATAWLYGCQAGWAVYEKLQDPKVRALSDKIEVISDETIDGLETRLTVKLKDGTEKSDRLFRPLGEESNPFTRDQIEEKFFSLTRPIYGGEVAVRIRDVIDAFEDHTIAELMSLVS